MTTSTARATIRGTVKDVKRAEGYGFLTDAVGVDYFFHRSQVRGIAFDDLMPDMLVRFIPTEGLKGNGQRALEVTPIDE